MHISETLPFVLNYNFNDVYLVPWKIVMALLTIWYKKVTFQNKGKVQALPIPADFGYPNSGFFPAAKFTGCACIILLSSCHLIVNKAWKTSTKTLVLWLLLFLWGKIHPSFFMRSLMYSTKIHETVID